jgi:AraC-like DNA-binding protein
MKVPLQTLNQSLLEGITEKQTSSPNAFSETILKTAGISTDHLNELALGKRSFTKDQLLMLSTAFQMDTRSLIVAYLKERIHHLSREKQSAQQVQNMAADLSHLKTSRFDVSTDIPDGLLGRFIESIILYEGNHATQKHERMLPDGVIHLVILLDDHERVCIHEANSNSTQTLKKAWVSGAQKRFRTFLVPPNEKTLTVRFKPGGFFALTGIPATEITNSFLPADQLFGPSLIRLRNALMNARTPEDCFDTLKCYLAKQYKTSGKSARSDVSRLHDITSKPVHQLADETGVSHKHLIHIFKKEIGLTPKYYQRTLRFGNTLKEILSLNNYPDWADIVYNFSFYDQPHFINEFRHFTGLSPQSYLETGNTCSKFLHLTCKR